jgi:integrase
LRSGELRALQWGDVDIERRRVRVRRTLAAIEGGKPVFASTSTHKNHERTVWLSEMAATALEARKGAQDVDRKKAERAWQENGLVFTDERGRPLWRSRIRREFNRLLKKAEVPEIRVHDLRHSAATLLLDQGVPVKVVSEMLGHTDVQTTLRIYAHVIEGAQEQAASAMDRLFHA